MQEAPGGRGFPPGDGNEIRGLWNSVRLAMETVPPGGSCRSCDLWGAWRLAARVPRQAVWKLAAPGGTCPPPGELYCCSLSFECEFVIYSASSDALRVRLLVFLELWLGRYPLSCGSG